MRRTDRETDRNFALEVMDKCAWAVLSMADSDEPYAVPLSIARDGEKVYFHCALVGAKTDMLRKNSRVCLVCVGDVQPSATDFSTGYESAIAFGEAREVTCDEEKTKALYLICARYTPELMHLFQDAISRSLKATAVWCVDIETVTGKRKAIG